MPRVKTPWQLSNNDVNFLKGKPGKYKMCKTMPFVKIWIHAIWTTKDRNPLLTYKARVLLFKHMRDYASDTGYDINYINGVSDHVHCLLSLQANQSLSDALKLIKGESSYWINKNHLTEEKFSWQSEFYAASIGTVQLKNLREYIKNQEAHHLEMDFQTEMLKLEKRIT